MFSLWAMMAMLLAARRAAHGRPHAAATLLNREVIAIDQDHAGLQGLRVTSRRGRDVWVRQLSGGERAVLPVNRTAGRRRSRKPESDVRRVPGRPLPGARPGRHRTRTTGRWVATVPAHGAAMFRIRPALIEPGRAGRNVAPGRRDHPGERDHQPDDPPIIRIRPTVSMFTPSGFQARRRSIAPAAMEKRDTPTLM